MNLEAVYFVSQIVAAAAVVGSLIFVGIQIRQNTRATRAAAAFEAHKAWADFQKDYTLSEFAHPKLFKIFTPGTQLEALNEQELHWASLYAIGLLQMFQSQYFLYREGSLPRPYWDRYLNWVRTAPDAEMVRHMFHIESVSSMADPAMLAEMFPGDSFATSAIAESPEAGVELATLDAADTGEPT